MRARIYDNCCSFCIAACSCVHDCWRNAVVGRRAEILFSFTLPHFRFFRTPFQSFDFCPRRSRRKIFVLAVLAFRGDSISAHACLASFPVELAIRRIVRIISKELNQPFLFTVRPQKDRIFRSTFPCASVFFSFILSFIVSWKIDEACAFRHMVHIVEIDLVSEESLVGSRFCLFCSLAMKGLYRSPGARRDPESLRKSFLIAAGQTSSGRVCIRTIFPTFFTGFEDLDIR